ncbi:MAG: hypothetical protein AB1468_02030 [Candidatus Micrarchaeota archaeon]
MLKKIKKVPENKIKKKEERGDGTISFVFFETEGEERKGGKGDNISEKLRRVAKSGGPEGIEDRMHKTPDTKRLLDETPVHEQEKFKKKYRWRD